MRKQTPKMSDSEWQIMKVLWKRSPLTAAEILEAVKPITHWSATTVYTLISRISEKGLLEIDNSVSPYVCRPKVKQEECRRQERRSFLERIYDGSARMLVSALLDDETLSEEELEEIHKLLEEKRKIKGGD